MSVHGALRRGDPTRLGPYRLLGRLGEGGQGVVYVGQAAGGPRVAVKVLHASLADDEQARRRFLREAAVARRVAGFCTAPVLDVGVADERLYIVSEYIDGSSLHRRVNEGGPLDEGGLHGLAVGTAAALAAIHRAGVVHRDFKPSNVLLGPDGPRVVDFGIARALDASTTQSSAVLGTPAYMSPEQVAGGRVGPASDVFSWATTIVFAATGEAAFGRDSIPAVLHRILHSEPNLSALPESLRPLVARCLAKRPSRRPTAAQLLLVLLGHDAAGTIEVPAHDLLREGAAAANSTPVATRRPTTRPASEPSTTRPASEPSTTRPASEPSTTHPLTTRPLTTGPAVPATRSLRQSGRTRRTWPIWAAAVALTLGIALAAPYLFDDAGGEGRDGRSSETFGSPIGDPMKGEGAINTLAVARMNGMPVAVTGGTFGDETLRLWNLRTGKQLGEPMNMDRGFFEDEGSLSVAVGTLDDRAIAVSGSSTSHLVSIDKSVRVWDLGTHRQVKRMSGHTLSVSAVAVGVVNGRTVAVTGSEDKTLRVWDLAAGKQLGNPLTGHTSSVTGLALGVLDGRAVAVSASLDETVRVWDLTTGKQRGAPLTGHTDRVNSVALGELDGRPIAVSGGSSADRTVRVWDLASGKPIGQPLTGHTGWIGGVAVTRIGGRTIAVSGSHDETLRVWDVATGKPIGAPFTGHRASVNTVAVVELDGRPVAVSGSSDGTVRRWSLHLPDPSASARPSA